MGGRGRFRRASAERGLIMAMHDRLRSSAVGSEESRIKHRTALLDRFASTPAPNDIKLVGKHTLASPAIRVIARHAPGRDHTDLLTGQLLAAGQVVLMLRSKTIGVRSQASALRGFRWSPLTRKLFDRGLASSEIDRRGFLLMVRRWERN